MKHDKQLALGFSPCPNDTVIFYAMVHHRIETHGFGFEMTVADVEELNTLASERQMDIIKISYANYPLIAGEYSLLTAGSALGYNCGPLVVTKYLTAPEQLKDARIAVPGIHTTANFLFSHFFPEANHTTAILFSKIEKMVADAHFDAGLIIHESRFTFKEKGLSQLADLGEMWNAAYGLPIPLGGIAVNRSLEKSVKEDINAMMKESVLFGINHPDEAKPFIRQHAATLDENVMASHINLYVNQFTVDLGDLGRNAVRKLLEGRVPENLPVFIDED